MRTRLIVQGTAVLVVIGLLVWGAPSAPIECDTDTDCMEKNGGDGGPG